MTASAPAPELLMLMEPGDVGDVSILADLLRRRPAWIAQGACADQSTERFFANPFSKETDWAIAVCQRCPVRANCLEFAFEHGVIGVWGGTTGHRRAALVKMSSRVGRSRVLDAPEVTWADLSSEQREEILATLAAEVSAVPAPTPCEECGELAAPGRRYCSPKCKSAASYRNRPRRPCANCGKLAPFKFCGERCRAAARRRDHPEKADERPSVSAEMAAVEAKLDEVFNRRPSTREAG